jgi:hypothetical protein
MIDIVNSLKWPGTFELTTIAFSSQYRAGKFTKTCCFVLAKTIFSYNKMYRVTIKGEQAALAQKSLTIYRGRLPLVRIQSLLSSIDKRRAFAATAS